jgi:hypothetical protein
LTADAPAALTLFLQVRRSTAATGGLRLSPTHAIDSVSLDLVLALVAASTSHDLSAPRRQLGSCLVVLTCFIRLVLPAASAVCRLAEVSAEVGAHAGAGNSQRVALRNQGRGTSTCGMSHASRNRFVPSRSWHTCGALTQPRSLGKAAPCTSTLVTLEL